MEETIEDVTAVKPQEMQLKSIHPQKKTLMFIFCFFCYYFLFHYVIAGNFGISGFIFTTAILLAAGVAAHLTSRFISLNHTMIRIENGSVQITNESNFLNSYNNTFIPASEIKGYELNDNPFFFHKQIIIYREFRSPYIITLADTKSLTLTPFLNSITRVVNKNNRLSSESFLSAFLKISIILLITTILQAIVVVLFDLHSLQKYGHPLVINSNVIWKFILVNLGILYVFRKLFYKQALRIRGKHIGYVVIVANFIVLCLVLSYVETANYSLLKLNKAEEIFKHRKDKTFTVNAGMEVDTTIMGYHYTLSSAGRRSAYNNLEHFLTSPVNSFQKDWYRLWVGQQYKHRIRKRNSSFVSERIRKGFLSENKEVFKKTVRATPKFYEVVYSDFNQSFNKKGFYSSALSSYKSVVPLLVVVPHFETFDEYKKEIKKDIAIFSLLILASISVGSGIAAFHR